VGAEDTFEMPDLFAAEATARIMPDGRPVTGLFAELSPRTREAIGVDPHWGSVKPSESTIGHVESAEAENEFLKTKLEEARAKESTLREE